MVYDTSVLLGLGVLVVVGVLLALGVLQGLELYLCTFWASLVFVGGLHYVGVEIGAAEETNWWAGSVTGAIMGF